MNRPEDWPETMGQDTAPGVLRSVTVGRDFHGAPRHASARAFRCRPLLFVFLCFLLVGCASHSPLPPETIPPGRTHTGTQKPYTVFGKTYRPLLSAHGYMEEGVASWYGPDFHGRSTACGEIYDMHGLTAAHRVLPMHTKVRVTNLENGRTITVRINDRGPFAKDRILDLSYAGARDLDLVGKGTALVRVEAEGSWTDDIPGTFFVQIGAFERQTNALALRAKMVDEGYFGTRVQQAVVNDQVFWRVQVGSYLLLSAAQDVLDLLQGRYPSSFVIAD